MRASIAVKEAGLDVVMVTKSLLGKAHTVMAEGGIAAALGNVDPQDNWKVHYGDIIEEGELVSIFHAAVSCDPLTFDHFDLIQIM